MTTLVTGAGGFIGSHVVRRLAARGAPVRALDLRFPVSLPETVQQIKGSILDPRLLEVAMQGVDHVIHAAAIADLWTPGRFDYDRVNVVGTCRLLAECRKFGAGMTYVSSYTTLIDRETKGDGTLDETVEVPPSRLLGPYPRSKRQAELCVIAACETGVDAKIVMPTAPVGRDDVNLTPPTKLISDLANEQVPGLLRCVLNLVDVEAVADAIVSARNDGKTGFRYLLAGEDMPIWDLADLVSGLCNVKPPGFVVPPWIALLAARVESVVSSLTGRPPKAPLTGVRLALRDSRFSARLARETLDFSPRPIKECLRESILWLNEKNDRDCLQVRPE